MYSVFEKLSFVVGITFVKANEDFMKLWIDKNKDPNINEKTISNTTTEQQYKDRRTIEILTEKSGLLCVCLMK